GALGQDLLEAAEDEVDVEAALVGLVDDDRVVGAQEPVVLELGEEDAVGHELDEAGVGDLVGEADLPAHGLSQRGAELLGDALGDGAGGDPAGLGVADQTAHAAAELEADLGDLRGLARAGLAGDDDDLVVADGLGDVVAALRDGQLVGVDALRDARGPRGERGLLRLDVGFEGCERGLAGRSFERTGLAQATTQCALVGGAQREDAFTQAGTGFRGAAGHDDRQGYAAVSPRATRFSVAGTATRLPGRRRRCGRLRPVRATRSSLRRAPRRSPPARRRRGPIPWTSRRRPRRR